MKRGRVDPKNRTEKHERTEVNSPSPESPFVTIHVSSTKATRYQVTGVTEMFIYHEKFIQ